MIHCWRFEDASHAFGDDVSGKCHYGEPLPLRMQPLIWKTNEGYHPGYRNWPLMRLKARRFGRLA
jgi:hypothetical protein